MLSIQIDTKSFEVVIYHQFNNIKLSFFATPYEIKFSIMYGYQLLWSILALWYCTILLTWGMGPKTLLNSAPVRPIQNGQPTVAKTYPTKNWARVTLGIRLHHSQLQAIRPTTGLAPTAIAIKNNITTHIGMKICVQQCSTEFYQFRSIQLRQMSAITRKLSHYFCPHIRKKKAKQRKKQKNPLLLFVTLAKNGSNHTKRVYKKNFI